MMKFSFMLPLGIKFIIFFDNYKFLWETICIMDSHRTGAIQDSCGREHVARLRLVSSFFRCRKSAHAFVRHFQQAKPALTPG